MSERRRVAIVMAGGAGERFWPLSRRLRPKQLLRLAHPELTLVEQTVGRLLPVFGAEAVYLATATHLTEATRPYVANLPVGNILAEPHKRNTSGCLVWAAASLIARDPDARAAVTMAVVPADHRIEPDSGFAATVRKALDVAEAEAGIVTIGVTPDRPETGYGYIEIAPDAPDPGGGVRVQPAVRFHEKPAPAEAARYVASGRFLWNSGTFFWTLDTFLTELERVRPGLAAVVPAIAALLAEGRHEEAGNRFAELPSVSIDHALMELASKVFVVHAAFEWDDAGAWDGLARSLPPDADGNVVLGDALTLDTRDSIVVNETLGATVVVLGAEELVVVSTGDAVLVMPKSRSQDVRLAVEAMRSRNPDKV
jgi:mannose-1-phosphate guanylyltransferase